MRTWARGRLAGLKRALARMPLRWRLIVASLGLLTVLLLGLGALVSLIEQSMLLQNQAATLANQARMVATQAPAGNPGFPNDNLYILTRSSTPPPTIGAPTPDFLLQAETLVERLTGPTTTATVLTTTGAPVVTTEQAYFLGPVTPSAQAVKNALALAPSDHSYLMVSDTAGQRQIMLLYPILQNDHTVGLLQLDASTRQVDDAVATTRLILLYGMVACLMIAGLLAWPLLDRALRPLAEMEEGARRIAGGDLTVRLTEPESDDEVGRLSRAFNTMVVKVEGAFNRQRRFVADVSHELRTPLTALGGGLEMLLLGADRGDTTAARRLIRGMYAETERMRHLVEDLLALARLDEGRAQMRLEAVEPHAALVAAAALAERLATGQRLTVETEPGLPDISADAERLRQTLLIVLDNAIKYTPSDGAITLAARKADSAQATGWVALDVRDTGAGIQEEALPLVFDRFYRVDPARARDGVQINERWSGAGLGLAIARGLVEAMGGRIAIASAQGEGTTVTIELPIWDAARLSSSELSSGRPAPPTLELPPTTTPTAPTETVA